MIILFVILGLILIYFALGFIVHRTLLHRRKNFSWDKVEEKGRRLVHQTTAIQAFSVLEKAEGFSVTSIKSGDGLTLKAYEIPGGEDVAICVHGYTVDARIMSVFALEYHRAGFSVLMPNLRGHGISEGNYITMSYKDRDDLISWIEYYTKKHPNCKILLHGASMGGATVLGAMGKNPRNVRAVISDCAFSDAPSVFAYHMKHMKFVTKFPAYYAFSAANVVLQGFNLKHAAPIKRITSTNIPVLFIHGDADRYVPYDMMDALYEACPSPKMKYTCTGAEHFLSHIANPEEYKKQVKEFLDLYYFNDRQT